MFLWTGILVKIDCDQAERSCFAFSLSWRSFSMHQQELWRKYSEISSSTQLVIQRSRLFRTLNVKRHKDWLPGLVRGFFWKTIHYVKRNLTRVSLNSLSLMHRMCLKTPSRWPPAQTQSELLLSYPTSSQMPNEAMHTSKLLSSRLTAADSNDRCSLLRFITLKNYRTCGCIPCMLSQKMCLDVFFRFISDERYGVALYCAWSSSPFPNMEGNRSVDLIYSFR